MEGPHEPSRSLSVLIVDDDPDSADSLALLLEHWNHRVCVAYDGQAAIDIYRSQLPEIVLLDVGLPDIDGYEVARALKREPHQAVLVALSGYGSDDERHPATEAGFDRHFVKPVNLHELESLLTSV
jgi:DNA-binding response OmpR family regulator